MKVKGKLNSTKASNASFAKVECGQCCLLNANTDVGEMVLMPMPRE
jgi:hypothetical protein